MPRASPAERDDLAHQAWAILVEAAERPEQRTSTYGELAGELHARTGRDLTGQRMLGPLTLIMDDCDRHGLPRLNDLAVSQAHRWPNCVPDPGDDIASERERVLAYPFNQAYGR